MQLHWEAKYEITEEVYDRKISKFGEKVIMAGQKGCTKRDLS